MPPIIWIPVLLLAGLIILGVNGISLSIWWFAPLVIGLIVVSLYWLSQRKTAGTTSSSSTAAAAKPSGKKVPNWLLYLGGAIALVLVVMYADQIVYWYQASGFRFSDTGLGRVLVPHLGARATDWVPLFAFLLILGLFLAKKLGLGTIWDAFIWTVLLIVAYLTYVVGMTLWDEISSGARKRDANRAEQGYTPSVHIIQYHGLKGRHAPEQVTLDPGRWHSYDWPYNTCVRYYPTTGVDGRSKKKRNQYQLRALGVERTVWVRVLEVGESWVPPGGTQSYTCS